MAPVHYRDTGPCSGLHCQPKWML